MVQHHLDSRSRQITRGSECDRTTPCEPRIIVDEIGDKPDTTIIIFGKHNAHNRPSIEQITSCATYRNVYIFDLSRPILCVHARLRKSSTPIQREYIVQKAMLGRGSFIISAYSNSQGKRISTGSCRRRSSIVGSHCHIIQFYVRQRFIIDTS